MAATLFFRRWCSAAVTEAAAAAPKKLSRWQRLKTGRAGVWLSSLLGDYKEACREVVVGAWERPVKASFYLSLVGAGTACFYTNPREGSFETDLKDMANQLGLLSPWIRNGVSDTHVQMLAKLQNQGCLRYLSFGLISLVYRAEYDEAASLYEARCSALSVPWRELHERVLDVGFAGRWWVLDNKMKDYDVNDEEFRNLPPTLYSTVPPAPHITELNEQMHKDSWKPIAVQEEEEGASRLAEHGGEEGGEVTESEAETQTQTQT